MLLITSILIAIFVSACLLNRQMCQYWKKRGIPYVPAMSLLNRNIFSSFLMTPGTLGRIYQESKGRGFIGFFQARNPVLMICSPDIIYGVLNKNFSCFSSTRKSECSRESDPLSQHLLALNGEKWKEIRSKLTPAFTSGKLKNMFNIIDCHVGEFLDFLNENEGTAIDAEEFCSRLSITSLLGCSFGVETNCKNPNNDKFIQVGKAAFEAGFWRLMKARFRMMWPTLFNSLRLDGYVKGHSSFCANFIKEVIEHRKATGFYRPDFVDILMKIKSEEGTDSSSKGGSEKQGMSDNLIIAQVFSFLVAGYETTTTTLCCALFELAQDSETAAKLRTEVRDSLQRNGGSEYESVNEMELLDRVIKEVLRKHPPVIFLPRVCTKAAFLPGTTVPIEPGTHIIIPVLALHQDPKFYPNPDEFLPQRFADNRKTSLPDTPYLPFSEGPRKCIGMRFALLEVKIALAKIVVDFDFELDSSTKRHITLEKYARTYKIKDKIHIIFKRRNYLTRNHLI